MNRRKPREHAMTNRDTAETPALRRPDMALAAPLVAQLRTIVATAREAEGAMARATRGLSVLFCDASAPQSTFAAEFVAADLGRGLHRIDLANVIGEYIGETEKNLTRIFDVAAERGSILLFDEAEALLGKRSEVRDAHDRYSNLETAFLLQRLESFRGIVIFATPAKKSSIDDAFLRRLRYVLEFDPSSPWRTESTTVTEYLSPGVYITEIDANVKPIEGVSTSTAELIGADCMARLQRLAGPVTPAWTDNNDHDPGVALLELLALLAERLGARLDLVTDEAALHASRLAAAALALLKDRELPQGSVLKAVSFHERQTSLEEGLPQDESGRGHRLGLGKDEAA